MSGSQDLAIAWCRARRVEVGIKSERDEEQKKRLCVCVWGGGIMIKTRINMRGLKKSKRFQ